MARAKKTKTTPETSKKTAETSNVTVVPTTVARLWLGATVGFTPDDTFKEITVYIRLTSRTYFIRVAGMARGYTYSNNKRVYVKGKEGGN